MLFNYKVRTTDGALKEGQLEAVSMDAAIEGLQRRNFIVVNVVPSGSEGGLVAMLGVSLERVSNRDVVLISRQLATLFDAKIPVLEALKTMAGEVEKNTIRTILQQVLEDIQGGQPMSAAMTKHPKLFSEFYVNMVRSGEESGKLGQVFNYLADYLERQYELRNKARNALVYPAFVMLAFLIVMMLMLTIVIPNLATIFKEQNIELPIYTRIVIGTGEFFRAFWIVIFVLVGIAGSFLWRFVHTPAGQLAWERFLLALPVLGTLERKIYMARFCDNLQTLLSAGVPVIRSLEVTASVMGSVVYQDIIVEAIEAVKGGSTISDALSRHADIPVLVTQMMRIGEEAGKMNTMLESLSRFYRREVDSLVENFVSIIEPAMILILGGGVAFLVASVLLPLYSLGTAF
ncbi:MAG: type II secretion system F family protein [Patescibacteria group bacterium]